MAGVAGALPIMIWFNIHPIHLWGGIAQAFQSLGVEPLMPLAVKGQFIISNILVVVLIVAVTCIYPVRKAMKLKVATSLHK
jgi:ABC-type lipoprotein release transport system permease subunit